MAKISYSLWIFEMFHFINFVVQNIYKKQLFIYNF